MGSTHSKREQDKIKELANEYEKKGYNVITHPKNIDLPDFLSNSTYQPDLIATSNKDNLIIEVTSAETISSTKYFQRIPNLVEQQENWDFILVLTNPKKKADYYEDKPGTTLQAIMVSIQKIEDLLSDPLNRYIDVSLLYLCTVLEAVLNIGLHNMSIDSKGNKGTALLRDSRMMGLISKDDYELFSGLIKLRRSVMHLLSDIEIDMDILHKAIQSLKRIFNYIKLEVIETEQYHYIRYLNELSQPELHAEIDYIISESCYQLIEEDEVISQTAMTNAFGWYCDDHSISNIEIFENECIVHIEFHASGEQDEDKIYHGTALSGSADAIIDDDKNIRYENISASIDY